jgi:putative DNA primase/helicase
MHDYLLAPTVEDAARAACVALNLDFRRVPADGKFYRLTIDGRRKDGGLCLFNDGLGGIAKNLKTGEQQLFFVDGQKGMSEAELKRQQRIQRLRLAEADAARQAGHAITATMAQRLWERLPPQAAHPYLTRKGVQNYGVRAFRHTLVIPVINSAHKIISLQLIAPDGARRFLKGGRVAGGFYVLGDAWTAPALIIAEEYATAASLHEATGLPVVVAFFAGNLTSVVEQWRQLRPEAQIVIAADDDWHIEGNPGVAKAKTAAFQFGALVAIPAFTGVNRTRDDTDFNDVARHFGVTEVRRQIEVVRVVTAPRLRCCGAYEAKKDGLYMTRVTREGT